MSSLGLVLIDQLVKFSVVNDTSSYWTRNFGISFGFFPSKFWFYINFLILILFFRLFGKKNQLGFLLIFSGGVSNLVDRVGRGYVVDFLTLPFFNFKFNLADFFITLGVLLILVKYISYEIRNKNNLSR